VSCELPYRPAGAPALPQRRGPGAGAHVAAAAAPGSRQPGRSQRTRVTRSWLAACLLVSCGGGEREAGPARDTPEAHTAAPRQTGPPAPDTTGTQPAAPQAAMAAGPASPQDSALIRAASAVIAFLRGERPFGDIAAADTVLLQLGPEGGGARVRVPRAALASRRNWQVPANGHSVALLPPPGDSVTLQAGTHFQCLPRDLAATFPELARLPHVGTLHQPRGATSCLQSWNLTLVFGRGSVPPRLVAAVYDQWEW
jgi:hypothetical protein